MSGSRDDRRGGAVEGAPKQRSEVQVFKDQLHRLREAGEMNMLPSNVSFDAFRNAAIVAVTDNPAILKCTRDSVFRAVRRLAAAGLVPDGREAAIVPFKDSAQAMPMVFGLLKIARNSGEIRSIWAEVVREGEELRVWIDGGERKFDHVHDPLRRAGEIVGAYAVATLTNGAVEFEPMGRDEIEKRRLVSRGQAPGKPSGVWASWYAEMAKKTVLRALCKRLPLSSDDLRRVTEVAAADDSLESSELAGGARRGGVRFLAPVPDVDDGKADDDGVSASGPAAQTGPSREAEDAETVEAGPGAAADPAASATERAAGGASELEAAVVEAVQGAAQQRSLDALREWWQRLQAEDPVLAMDQRVADATASRRRELEGAAR